MLPEASITTIVAPSATFFGAARIALAISCASLGAFAALAAGAFFAGLAVSAADATPATAVAIATTRYFIKRGASISPSQFELVIDAAASIAQFPPVARASQRHRRTARGPRSKGHTTELGS